MPAQITADALRSNTRQPVAPTLSTNTHLNALAQLGPLKLRCDRSFVSLLDTSIQYIIAEATQSISLRHSTRHDCPQDALFLGVQALHKSYGVCPNTVQVFTDPTGQHAVDNPEIVANTSRYIIRDFRVLDGYKDRPYVKGFPHMRSYAEVPMKSSNGRVIGSYCVVDTELREDFFADQTVYILQEIADSIVEYLELVTVGQNHDRGARLMEGLSLFADGKSTRTPTLEHMHAASTSTLGAAETTAPSWPPQCPSLDHSMSLTNSSDIGPSDHVALDDVPKEDPVMQDPASRSRAASDASDHDLAHDHHHSATLDALPTHAPQPSPVADYRTTFSRAANLIREAIEIDGLVFLDASIDGADDSIRKSLSRRGSSISDSASILESLNLNQASDTSPGRAFEPQSYESHSRQCHVLGSSLTTAGARSIRGESRAPLVLSEASLQFLVREYPHGHIFAADDYGVLFDRATSDGDEPLIVGGEMRSKLTTDALPHELQDLFETARSIIFLPVWDFTQEEFFAGLIGWTTDPTRVFDREDVTCMAAFGDAVKTELARLEALDVARTKSDFVSSISHELRSPLHGILASAEILNDLLTNDSQSEMVQMIENCGSTLLDTLNHLLDFSRLDAYNNSKGQSRKTANAINAREGVYGRLDVENLSELLQEVVQGVHFGQTSNHAVHAGLSGRSDKTQGNVQCVAVDKAQSAVAVFIDIEKRSDWRIAVRVGAWKRIIMNLFANSLKYTRSGYVKVSLKRVSPSPEGQSQQSQIHLTVRDTGIGMSPHYQKHHLFKPFAQENTLSSGTGLGLSIVKQIVDSLSGSINVKSAQGVGTRIDVVIPVNVETSAAEALPRPDSQVLDPAGALHGKTLCLVLPESSLGDRHFTSEYQDIDSKTIRTTKSLLTKLARTYLGMEVRSAQSLDEAQGDFLIVDNSFHADLPATLPQSSAVLNPRKIIILGSAMNQQGSQYTSLRYPIGPRTLSRALIASLDTKSETPITSTAQNYNVLDEPRRDDSFEHDRTPDPVEIPDVTSPSSSSSSRHLLLVDDNVINLRILSSYVKKLGCTAVLAENGQEAIDKFKSSERPFDVVFMDISMPLVDGFEASRAIREYEREISTVRPTRIIALTGLGSEASRQQASVSGIDEFRTKPVPMKDVKAVVENT